MFTGIVEELGEVTAVENLGDASRFRLRGPVVTEGAKHGDSIAVNGVCLTVVEHERRRVHRRRHGRDPRTAPASAPSTVGSRVNLERPMAARRPARRPHRPGPRRRHRRRSSTARPPRHWEIVKISLPADLTRYVVEKGSITVDGVSLTVVDAGADYFTVSLIPTTLDLTTLGLKQPGDPVNLEVDVIAKYVERLLGDRARDQARRRRRPRVSAPELAELRGLHRSSASTSSGPT